MNQSIFDNKGNPALIKGQLDEGRKKDLRATHFNMGSHADHYTLSSNDTKSAPSTGLDNSNKFEAKALLKNSG